MKKNVGTIDMTIRLLVAAVMVYIGFFDNPIVSEGLSKKIIGLAAILPVLTGLFRFCPLYTLIDLNTCGKK
ncbi:MAG: DUF2892 domain-containing protein [Proteobacteria bacterium]|nr:DUF2892 domain-containing protein [Pseudomonadota bacterium]MBU1687179.1 DUF2892 domain-containing protein [Pseudomonadota bacterium]